MARSTPCSSFPPGILYDHVIPVIANGVVVDLPTLFNEVDMLEARGISCAELKVSSRAHLIFPWHQAHDAIAEAMRGDDKIGTTLEGHRSGLRRQVAPGGHPGR